MKAAFQEADLQPQASSKRKLGNFVFNGKLQGIMPEGAPQ